MPSVYDPENFTGRVSLAASYISAGRDTTRSFDTCFEMWDGDAVCVALYRRAQKNPEGPLAQNIWRYLVRETVEPLAIENADRKNLAAWASEVRAKEQAASDARWAKAREDQARRNAAFEAAKQAEQLPLFA